MTLACGWSAFRGSPQSSVSRLDHGRALQSNRTIGSRLAVANVGHVARRSWKIMRTVEEHVTLDQQAVVKTLKANSSTESKFATQRSRTA
jgi:hypothetical protein